MKPRPTLKQEVRRVVDEACYMLTQPEILRLMRVPVSLEVLSVECANMVKAGYLCRRKARKVVRVAMGARVVYGPGKRAVPDGSGIEKTTRKLFGFMAEKRAREARARGRARADA